MNKTDLNDLVTCRCGIVLELSRIRKSITEENYPTKWFYECPLCKRRGLEE